MARELRLSQFAQRIRASKSLLPFPRWASELSKWPVLRDDMKPVEMIQSVQPLRHGYLALALAGGFCDGIIESGGNQFRIKGDPSSAIR